MTSADTFPPDRRLDGNALAGPLLQLFAVDLSAAVGTCAHCDVAAPLAEQQLYADAPALVLRCRGCSGVLLRYSSDSPGADVAMIRADFSGLRLLVAAVPTGVSR